MAASGVVPHLWVSGLAASVQLYTEAFGFDVALRYPEAGEMSWCALRLGESEIMLAAPPAQDGPAGGPSPEFRAAVRARVGVPGACSLYIRVEDVAAHHARAAAHGARIVDPLADRPWGQREYTAADPDGFWLTFWQPV